MALFELCVSLPWTSVRIHMYSTVYQITQMKYTFSVRIPRIHMIWPSKYFWGSVLSLQHCVIARYHAVSIVATRVYYSFLILLEQLPPLFPSSPPRTRAWSSFEFLCAVCFVGLLKYSGESLRSYSLESYYYFIVLPFFFQKLNFYIIFKF